MNFKKLLNIAFALIITGGILLLSDLSNRNLQSKDNAGVSGGIYAIEGRSYKIGFSYFGPDPVLDITMEGLWKGLGELGFIKDSNLTVVAQSANAELANFHPIHTNLDNLDVDLILVTSTPAISSAVTAIKNKPVVFTFSYTPLEAGAGKTYEDHLPFITGVGSYPPVERTVEFIRDVFPKATRIGTVYNSSEVNSRKVVENAKGIMAKNGLTLVENTVVGTSEVYQAVSALCMRKIDLMWITGDNTMFQSFDAVIKICRDNNIPLIINDNDFVKTGVLAAIGISWGATGYRTASYVAKVLNGESPANIPIENYVEELVTINDSEVKKFGLKIPDKYLKQEIVDLNEPIVNQAINSLKGKKLKLCLAHYALSEISEEAESGLRAELKKSGLTEGQDYTLKVYNASGDISTANSIAESVAAEKWDLIFTASTPTLQIFIQKVKDMPIVFTNSGDPVGAGAGISFESHLPNVTGISTVSDFEGMVKLVKESIPGVKSIGTVYTPGEINSVFYMEELRKAATKNGLNLIVAPANSVTEVSDATQTILAKGVEAFTQIADNLTSGCSSVIIKHANDNNLPYFAFITSQVEKGAVAAIARDYHTAGSDAVKVAIQVLNGKSPKDIPFRLVSKSNVTVNREVMERLNMKIPDKYFK
ncbi:MAG: ABC transporter substrate-binding protein [Paludibacter sp.]|nr:ABC transporter substrate-binding protein [Paludibacter sp.]